MPGKNDNGNGKGCDAKDRPERKWGEEYNFHKGDDNYQFGWMNTKKVFDLLVENTDNAQKRSQTAWDQLVEQYATNNANLQSAHTDLIRKLNTQYADQNARLNEAYAVHSKDLNSQVIKDMQYHRENMRHGYNRVVNLDPEEAVSIEKILNEPFLATIKAAVSGGVLDAFKAAAEAEKGDDD